MSEFIDFRKRACRQHEKNRDVDEYNNFLEQSRCNDANKPYALHKTIAAVADRICHQFVL